MSWIKTCVENYLITKCRCLTGPYATIVNALAAAMGAFYLYTSGFGIITIESHLGVFFAITMALIFLSFPGCVKAPMDRFTPWDLLFALLGLGVGFYFIFSYPDFVQRVGAYTNLDVAVGVLTIILSIEAARRSVGLLLPVVSVLALLYAYKGISQALPSLIAHRGFDFIRISTFMYTTLDGLFGVVTYTLATYVIPFALFGAFLQRSGVGKFFINLPYAIFGTSSSGTAQVAVIGSALLGTVSGSPVANVVTTGTFTLPLMRKGGYKPEVAGAIESAASSGSMFMPPVMGSAAFFMVEFTGIPYIEIVKVAMIPAILYYLGVSAMVHIHAAKHGLKGLPKEALPQVGKVLKEGWYLSLPLVVLVLLLVKGYSPTVSAFWASISSLAVSWVKKETRMGLRDIYDCLAGGSKSIMMIASVAGAVGIIVGVLGISGLSYKFSTIILSLAQGHLFPTIVLVMIASFVLGCGVPIAAVYVILAILAPPAMTELGVPVVAAHLMLIWYSQLSGITPPVCLVAYAAAAITQADPFKTGWEALKFSSFLFIIPLCFVYTPLLLTGTALENTVAILTAAIAVVTFAIVLQGYLFTKTSLSERVLFGLGTLLMFTADFMLNGAGVAILSVAFFAHWARKKRLLARMGTPY
jgi:TRAP transporter 4TM/12TM fusion protein